MVKNKRNHWNKENCKIAANQCKTINEFSTKFSGAYKSSYKNGWLEEITINLIKNKKGNNYWCKEKCKEEALKYKTRTDFYKFSRGAYKSAIKNFWLDEICKHMIVNGDLYKRFNYVYMFDDNHVYIGLTCDINRRKSEHSTNIKSPVFKHTLKTGLKPTLIIYDLLSASEAQKKEKKLILDFYNLGFKLLNLSKGGGLGKTNTKWSKEKCQQEALKYSSRLEFQLKSHTAYKFCLKNKIMDFVCSHMVKKVKKVKTIISREKWSKEKCQQEALKYLTKKQFYTESQNAYRASIRNNFLNDICSHMI